MSYYSRLASGIKKTYSAALSASKRNSQSSFLDVHDEIVSTSQRKVKKDSNISHIYICILVFLALVLLQAGEVVALVCETGARQKPLYLTKRLALLAGDVVNFKVNGSDGWIGPNPTTNIANTCLEIPLSLHLLNITDTQFIIVPVAVLDEVTVEQAIENPDGSSPGAYTKPRLVSTIQLVHVSSGRVLGTKKIKSVTSSNVPPPVLLPSKFGEGCNKNLADYNSVWDLDVHELDSETVTDPVLPPGPLPPLPPIPSLNELFPALPGTNTQGSVATVTPTAGFKPLSYSSNTNRPKLQDNALAVEGAWPNGSVVSPGYHGVDPLHRAKLLQDSSFSDLSCMTIPEMDGGFSRRENERAKPFSLGQTRPHEVCEMETKEEKVAGVEMKTLQETTPPAPTPAGVQGLLSTLFSSGNGGVSPDKLGLENMLGSNDGLGLAGAKSIEEAASNAAAAAGQSLINTSPSNLFTDRGEDALNSQHQTFLEQHLSTLQAQQMSTNSNLTSVAHASILGLQSAMVSLRVREIGVGPVELVVPCNGYITEQELAEITDGIITKPISIFSSSTGKGNNRGRPTTAAGSRLPPGFGNGASLSNRVQMPNGDVVDSSIQVLRATVTGTAPKTTLSYTMEKVEEDRKRNWEPLDTSKFVFDEDDELLDDDDEDDDNYANDEEDEETDPAENESDVDSQGHIFVEKSDLDGRRRISPYSSADSVSYRAWNNQKDRQYRTPNSRRRGFSSYDRSQQQRAQSSRQSPASHASGPKGKQGSAGKGTKTASTSTSFDSHGSRMKVSSWMDAQKGLARDGGRKDWASPLNREMSTQGVSASRSRPASSSSNQKSTKFSTFSKSDSSTTTHQNGFDQSKPTSPQHVPGKIPRTGEPRLDSFLAKLERETPTTAVKAEATRKSTFSTSKAFKTQENGEQDEGGDKVSGTESHCTMRAVMVNGVRDIQCVPTSSSCPTPAAVESNTLWAITRVPFNDVPTSSLFLAESMSNLNYDMDYASINTFPFMIGQMGLRNFSPFEQFLTAKCSKIVTTEAVFRWLVGFTPAISVAFGDLPGAIFGGLSPIINNLLAPLITLLESFLPGISDIIPAFTLPTVALSTISLAIPLVWAGSVTHTESQEIVVSYSVTAPPQAHVLGRAIAHMGKSSVPFTLDVTRRVHVPAGIYGQTTGQLIAYDYRIPGVYEGAKLINTEFLIDTV